MKIIIALLAAIIMSNTAPDLDGFITHYDCPPWCGRTASRDWYDPWAFAGAVDCDLFPLLNGSCLLVRPEQEGYVLPWLFVTVNDCGYLAEAGVAVDLPEATFWLISPQAEDGHLAGVFSGNAWVVPKHWCPKPHADWWEIIE